jgi:hypothetical protein
MIHNKIIIVELIRVVITGDQIFIIYVKIIIKIFVEDLNSIFYDTYHSYLRKITKMNYSQYHS